MNKIIDEDEVIIRKELKEIKDKSLLDSNGDGDVSLYLFENKNTKTNPITIYNLNIDTGIINEMRKCSKEYLVSIFETIKKGSLSAIPVYDPDKRGRQSIFRIATEEVPMLEEIYGYLSGELSCTPYKKEKRKEKQDQKADEKDGVREDKLKAWIFRTGLDIKGNNEQIYFFQRFQPANILKGKRVVIKWEKDGGFKLLEGDIFSLNQEMEFLLYRNTFVVTDMFSFEKTFNYEKFYKEKATKLVNDLDAKAIPGLDYDVDFVSITAVNTRIDENTPLAHKFHSARKHGYYKVIAFNKLVDLDSRYGLGLTLDHATKKWIIEEDSDLKLVGRILNDDYERSQLTPNDYIALSKERPSHSKPAVPPVAPSKGS